MESHKIWIANLNDLLTNHVCQGLIKTYNEILRLCGGHKLKLSIQTAMEGIAHLSTHKLNADYKVLLDSLVRIGYNEVNLNDLVNNAYSSYALSALRSAGIKCDKLDASLLNGPRKSAFIHEVYINVARHIWTRPDVLIEQNIPQLKMYVRESVEQAVRSGVNLNFIIDALESGAIAPAKTSVASVAPLTIKEKLSTLNGGKSILDDDSDDGASSEDEVKVSKASKVSKVSNSRIPDAPSILGEMTIENDDLAPDNMTITTSETAAGVDSSLQVNKSNPDDDMIIDVHTRNVPIELSENTSNYTATEDEEDEDEESENLNLNINDDEATDYTVRTSVKPEVKAVKDKEVVKAVKEADEEINMLDDTDSIPSCLVVGEISRKIVRNASSASASASVKPKVDDESSSVYSVTLLSHRDMLSSRLSKLGLKG